MNAAAERLRGQWSRVNYHRWSRRLTPRFFFPPSVSQYEDSVCPLHPWFTSRSDHDQDIRCGHSPVSSLHEHDAYVENLPFWLSGDLQMHMFKGLLCLISWGISPADKLWPCHDKISLLPVIFFRLLLPFQLSSLHQGRLVSIFCILANGPRSAHSHLPHTMPRWLQGSGWGQSVVNAVLEAVNATEKPDGWKPLRTLGPFWPGSEIAKQSTRLDNVPGKCDSSLFRPIGQFFSNPSFKVVPALHDCTH